MRIMTGTGSPSRSSILPGKHMMIQTIISEYGKWMGMAIMILNTPYWMSKRTQGEMFISIYRGTRRVMMSCMAVGIRQKAMMNKAGIGACRFRAHCITTGRYR